MTDITLLDSKRIVVVDVSAKQANLLGISYWCGNRDRERVRLMAEAYTGKPCTMRTFRPKRTTALGRGFQATLNVGE